MTFFPLDALLNTKLINIELFLVHVRYCYVDHADGTEVTILHTVNKILMEAIPGTRHNLERTIEVS